MKYKQAKKQFKRNQIKSTLRLLKLSRVVLCLIMKLETIDGQLMKFICVLLGFQYDIYMKLRDASYNNSYLEDAERIKQQIAITLPLIGE